MKRLLGIILALAVALSCVGIAAFAEEYYLEVELSNYKGDSLSYNIKFNTNCPEVFVEIYYPDGTLRREQKYTGTVLETGVYCDNSSYSDNDGEYLHVFYYEDCRVEHVYTIENSDLYRARQDYWLGLTGNNNNKTETESSENKGGSSTKINPISVSEERIEICEGAVKEITVTSSKAVTVEVEDSEVISAEYSGGVLSVTALKAGESEIWLRTSETYTAVSAKVVKESVAVENAESVNDEITISVNGRIIETDCEPYIKNDRTMVPMRAIFEALGATVRWNNRTKTAIGTKGSTDVKITIGEEWMRVKKEKVSLDAPAEIKNGRTMVPVRAISEALGASVSWDNENKAVVIELPILKYTEHNIEEMKIKTTYNEAGKAIRTEEEYDDGTVVVTSYSYDEHGRITEQVLNGNVIERYEYDEQGRLILMEYNYGMWYKGVKTYEYDDEKNSMRYEDGENRSYFEYDDNGYEIYEEYSVGSWAKSEYTDDGIVIKSETSTGEGWENTFDDEGRIVLTEYKNGYWEKREYDENGNVTFEENSDGWWRRYEYDEMGNLVLSEDVNGFKTVSEYDENGNETYLTDSEGQWRKCEYDENSNLIYMENHEGEWSKHSYDENGNGIYYERSDGYWEKTEFDEKGNKVYFENSDGETRKWEWW